MGGKRSAIARAGRGSPDRVIARLARRQHGVVSRRQLIALGIERRVVDRRTERGSLSAIHRGVYAAGQARLTIEGRWTAAVLACGANAVLSHRSAAQLWGMLPRARSVPEVTRPTAARRRSRIIVRRGSLPGDELDVVDGIPTTSATRTLLDLAPMLSHDRLETAFNEMEVRRLTSKRSLPELLERYPRRRGSAALRRLLSERSVAGGIGRNEFEQRFAVLLDSAGLPRPRFNADLAVRGRFYEVDCLWRSQRVVVELDGHAVHGTRHAFETDRERDRILLAEGWRPLRVTWWQLRDEPEAIIGDLRGLLAAGAARG
jgi:very-short-patch-repair endonuclease